MTQVLGIVKEGKLIPEELWQKFVKGLENDFDSLETNNERAKRELAKVIVEAVRKRVTQKFGILFSGGVDSSLIAFIAKQLKCNFTCYTVGIEGSDDIEWAKKAADEYGFNFRHKILNLNELESVIKSVIKILNDINIVKVSVGSVLYAGAKLALADGNSVLFGGLGSEEIFAGYQRHEDALQNGFEALHKECWNGLKGMRQRDLTRDFAIAKNLGLDLRTPFLDKDLIKVAMNIHPMYKLDTSKSKICCAENPKGFSCKEHKKIILREAAELIGLEKEFAWRKKQAAQYGSNFVNGIDKLARKNGFKTKKDYLASLANKSF